MTLVAANFGPVSPIIAPVTNRALMQSISRVHAVLVRGAVTIRMSAGTIVALVAGHAARATAIVGSVAIATIQGAEIRHMGAVGIPRRPPSRMSSRTVVTVETADAAGAAQEVDAVAGRARTRTIGSDSSPVLGGVSPTLGMTTGRSIMALVTFFSVMCCVYSGLVMPMAI